MLDEHWDLVAEVYGELQGELIRGLLDAQGIPVTLNQEGAGRAYGLNVGPLGQIQVLVPSRYSQEARRVLADYEAGLFEPIEDESDEQGEGELVDDQD